MSNEYDDEAMEYRMYVYDDEDDEDDYRNARPRYPRPRPAYGRDDDRPGRPAPGRGRGRGGRPRSPRGGSPRAQTVVRVPVRRPPSPPDEEPVVLAERARLPEIGAAIELGAEALAATLPVPQPPPDATGKADVDLYNQDQHRHALALRNVTADRIRAFGKVAHALSKVFSR